MNIERTNPSTVHPTTIYSHAVRIKEGELVIIAGQVAFDRDGNLVGEGDLAAQTAQVFQNISNILESIGATAANLVKVQIFVANFQPQHREIIAQATQHFFDPAHRPASTLLGVQALARPEILIEVEAMAVV